MILRLGCALFEAASRRDTGCCHRIFAPGCTPSHRTRSCSICRTWKLVWRRFCILGVNAGKVRCRLPPDPPFAQDWWQRLAPLVLRVAAPEALVYCEFAKELTGRELPGFSRSRHDRAGMVHYHLFTPHIAGAAEPRSAVSV